MTLRHPLAQIADRVTGDAVPRAALPRYRPLPRTPVERELRSSTRWGWVLMVTTPAAALLIAWTLYAQPEVASDGATFWSWIVASRMSGDPIAVNAMLGGMVLPLFVVTQIGRVLTHERSDAESARMAGLEAVTLAACWIASILGWLLVPSTCAAPGGGVVDDLLAMAIPVLFSWLTAFANPSESMRLARDRAAGRWAEAHRVSEAYEKALIDHFGSAPGRNASSRKLWITVWHRGIYAGATLGVVLAVRRLVRGGVEDTGRAVIMVLLATVLFAGLYSFAMSASVDSEVARVFRGRRGQTAAVPALLIPVFGTALGAASAASGEWMLAVAFIVLVVAPTVLAVVQTRSSLTQTLVHRQIRARVAALERDRRTAAVLAAPPRLDGHQAAPSAAP